MTGISRGILLSRKREFDPPRERASFLPRSLSSGYLPKIPVNFLNKATFEAKLRQRFSCDSDCGGWLYNCLSGEFGCEPYTISARATIDTLIDRTQRIVQELGSRYPIWAFPDSAAGWRDVSSNRRTSPIELLDADELSQLLRRHIYFRDPGRRIDNYHISDIDFRWIVVFSHHDDWHFYGRPDLVAHVKKVMKRRSFDKQSADEIRRKIAEGMDSIRAGRTIPAEQVKAEIAAFKEGPRKNRGL